MEDFCFSRVGLHEEGRTAVPSYSLLLQLLLSLSCVQLIVTPWTAAHQDSLSFTISRSLLKLIFVGLVMPSNHLVFRRPLLLLPSIFPSIRVLPCNCPAWPSFPWVLRCHINWMGVVHGEGFCSASQIQDRSSACLSGIFRLDGENWRFWNCASLIISFQEAKFS